MYNTTCSSTWAYRRGKNGRCQALGLPWQYPVGLMMHWRKGGHGGVCSVNGDCAFGFNCMEMETAVRHKLPIVFLVNNNSGIVGANLEARMGLPEGYPERVATYTPEIRYDK